MRTSRKILGLPVPAAIAGGVVLAGGGVALAAILLTTTIGGTATVDTVATSNKVEIKVDAVNGTQLKCDVSGDEKILTINPHLTKPIGGGNASGVPVAGGDCTITVRVTNTGQTTLHVDPSSGLTKLPTGWTTSPITGSALNPIAPGATASLSAKLVANQDAEPGPITGKLVYSD